MGREQKKMYGFFVKERIKQNTCILHNEEKYKLITNTTKFTAMQNGRYVFCKTVPQTLIEQQRTYTTKNNF
jgi:hypothetical protein